MDDERLDAVLAAHRLDPHPPRGDPVADRLAEGYAGFSSYTDVRFHPYEEIGDLDPRGYYLVWGGRDDAEALLHGLEELGLGGVVATMPGLADLRMGYAAIDVTYVDVPAGGRITYRATNAAQVQALHDSGQAQVSDHGDHAEHG